LGSPNEKDGKKGKSHHNDNSGANYKFEQLTTNLAKDMQHL
jgi:hypothetical protein